MTDITRMGFNWINLFGLIIIILMLIPNIVYAIKCHDQEEHYSNVMMNLLEQIGRYASMFLMVFHIGLSEFGFSSVKALVIYGAGNVVLLVIYWVTWVSYFRRPAFEKRMALAVVPVGIFLLSGITLRYILLIVSAVIFGMSHIYITYQNAKIEK